MSFVSRPAAMKTMMAACLAHAEKKGWSLHYNIAERKNYWKDETWWPEMETFILHYQVNTETISTWSFFDKMDAGIITEYSINTLPPDVQFKRYVAAYLRAERLK